MPLQTLNPPYAELTAAWKALRATHDVSVREVACVGALRTLLVAEIVGPPRSPVVALSAGVHGDEPSGPWSLLSIVRDGLLDRRFSYRIWPLSNPSGYQLGTRENAEGDDINRSFQRGGTTPEARAIVIANRDRRFALSIDLHEDFEADGYYCYEPMVLGRAPFGAAVVRALDDAGFPVQDLDDDFELGYPPEAHHIRSLERGRVLNDHDAERAYFDTTPYSVYLLRRAAAHAVTLESPRTCAWEARIAMHRTAVVTVLETLAALPRAAA